MGRINWKIGEFFLSQQAKSDAFDCRVVHIVFKRVKILVVAHVRQGLCDHPDFQGVFDGKQIPQIGNEIRARWEDDQPLHQKREGSKEDASPGTPDKPVSTRYLLYRQDSTIGNQKQSWNGCVSIGPIHFEILELKMCWFRLEI